MLITVSMLPLCPDPKSESVFSKGPASMRGQVLPKAISFRHHFPLERGTRPFNTPLVFNYSSTLAQALSRWALVNLGTGEYSLTGCRES